MVALIRSGKDAQRFFSKLMLKYPDKRMLVTGFSGIGKTWLLDHLDPQIATDTDKFGARKGSGDDARWIVDWNSIPTQFRLLFGTSSNLRDAMSLEDILVVRLEASPPLFRAIATAKCIDGVLKSIPVKWYFDHAINARLTDSQVRNKFDSMWKKKFEPLFENRVIARIVNAPSVVPSITTGWHNKPVDVLKYKKEGL